MRLLFIVTLLAASLSAAARPPGYRHPRRYFTATNQPYYRPPVRVNVGANLAYYNGDLTNRPGDNTFKVGLEPGPGPLHEPAPHLRPRPELPAPSGQGLLPLARLPLHYRCRRAHGPAALQPHCR
ncbi:MAG: hypothetical protein WKG07_10865 [Hymenobacter sp.]